MEWKKVSEPPVSNAEKNIRYKIGSEWVRDTGYYESSEWFDSRTDRLFPKAFLVQDFEWLDEDAPSFTIQQGLDIWEAGHRRGFTYAKENEDLSPNKQAYFLSIGIDISKL